MIFLMSPVIFAPFLLIVLVTMMLIREATADGGFELFPGRDSQLPPQKLSALVA